MPRQAGSELRARPCQQRQQVPDPAQARLDTGLGRADRNLGADEIERGAPGRGQRVADSASVISEPSAPWRRPSAGAWGMWLSCQAP
jgi:hypothetical protein